MEKQRADLLLFSRGLAPSRERARALIRAGQVTADGRPVAKPAALLDENAVLAVADGALPYVSRGGLKLDKAVRRYALDLTGCLAVDVGASTGGFTDCMLRFGAAHVWAVDVGTDQLAPSLRADARVTVMEQTNAREMTPAWFPAPLDFAATDVSFISVRLILPAMHACLRDGARAVVLVNPSLRRDAGAWGKTASYAPRRYTRTCSRGRRRLPDRWGFPCGRSIFRPLRARRETLNFCWCLKKAAARVSRTSRPRPRAWCARRTRSSRTPEGA